MKQGSSIIREAKETWQKNYSQELTDDDALEIMSNLVGFFRLLQEWKQDKPTSNQQSSKLDCSNESVQ